jgi:major membrane immunogen (membrane-anchored lipoprotein)
VYSKPLFYEEWSGMRLRIKMVTLFLLAALLLLTACGAKDFSFSGESDHWQAELKVNQSSDFEKQDFVLKYTGDEVESVEDVEYAVESIDGFGRTGATLDKNGIIRDGNETDPSGRKISDDTEVTVTVMWDGQSETFDLKLQE